MSTFVLYFPIWKEALILTWPVMLNHIFTTAMRTADMILMGFFGPAAVTAVGLGDIWEQIVLRIAQGLGAGCISLIAQESGNNRENTQQRVNEILSQILYVGILLGIPFMIIGLIIPRKLIGVLGAAPEVIELGAQYLLIIFLAAPFRIMTIIFARALQGTGNTKTPMFVEIAGNAINIVISIILALGIGPFPGFGVMGVGLGTLIAKFLSTLIYIIIFMFPGSYFKLINPFKIWDLIIIKQLFKVSMPKIMEGVYRSLFTFPFNALILTFGTEAAAAYHIAHRINQQLIAPLYRSYFTVTTVLGGQKLGKGEAEEGKKTARAMFWLSGITIAAMGVTVFFTAPWVVKIFTNNAETVNFGIKFLRAMGLGASCMGLYGVYAGMLNGAGNTKAAFYGNLISQPLFRLGLSYLLSIVFHMGILGILIGITANFIFRTVWVGYRYLLGDWVDEAAQMIKERNADSR